MQSLISQLLYGAMDQAEQQVSALPTRLGCTKIWNVMHTQRYLFASSLCCIIDMHVTDQTVVPGIKISGCYAGSLLLDVTISLNLSH